MQILEIFTFISSETCELLVEPGISSVQKNTLFRCFLEGGGSTDSFFVREDLPVSLIIIRFVIKD